MFVVASRKGTTRESISAVRCCLLLFYAVRRRVANRYNYRCYREWLSREKWTLLLEMQKEEARAVRVVSPRIPRALLGCLFLPRARRPFWGSPPRAPFVLGVSPAPLRRAWVRVARSPTGQHAPPAVTTSKTGPRGPANAKRTWCGFARARARACGCIGLTRSPLLTPPTLSRDDLLSPHTTTHPLARPPLVSSRHDHAPPSSRSPGEARQNQRAEAQKAVKRKLKDTDRIRMERKTAERQAAAAGMWDAQAMKESSSAWCVRARQSVRERERQRASEESVRRERQKRASEEGVRRERQKEARRARESARVRRERQRASEGVRRRELVDLVRLTEHRARLARRSTPRATTVPSCRVAKRRPDRCSASVLVRPCQEAKREARGGLGVRPPTVARRQRGVWRRRRHASWVLAAVGARLGLFPGGWLARVLFLSWWLVGARRFAL